MVNESKDDIAYFDISAYIMIIFNGTFITVT